MTSDEAERMLNEEVRRRLAEKQAADDAIAGLRAAAAARAEALAAELQCFDGWPTADGRTAVRCDATRVMHYVDGRLGSTFLADIDVLEQRPILSNRLVRVTVRHGRGGAEVQYQDSDPIGADDPGLAGELRRLIARDLADVVTGPRLPESARRAVGGGA